ncbi:cache domain-containing sensor histidine kinase [Paenibacillus sp. SYP-B4298]|uniref:cache domain-containing sensor histidine kinase n=1 Tax=Paenibacillus sp. SYP-B4298 TaxID=2996034 RepID=UPI0022DD2400|nr:sensor histidine kinase [Paenibacillus sp. SYP-B4298]
MRLFWPQFRHHRLFMKIFSVLVISIVLVTLLTLTITIRMSERLFMETFSITNSKVLSQIKQNFESYHNAVVNLSFSVSQSGAIRSFLSEEDTTSLEVVRSYFGMQQMMKRYRTAIDPYGAAITILGNNGRAYTPEQTLWPIMKEELLRHPLTDHALAEPRRLSYQLYTPDKAAAGEEPLIVATKVLMERTSDEVYGMLYVTIREQDFNQFYRNFTSKGNQVMLLDESGRIVSSDQRELIGSFSPELLQHAQKVEQQQLDYLEARVMGKDSIVLSQHLPSYGFYLVNLIDKQYAVGQVVNVKAVVLTSMGVVLVALIILFPIIRNMIKSLTRLVRQMSNLTKNNFNKINVSGSYEIQELGRAFNYMVDELQDHMRQLVTTQQEQRRSELAALQSQINPHFLYNTLASVKILVQQGSKEKAADTINALISLLHNSIGNIRETNTVEQELEQLRSYVFINHIRYGERIRVHFFVSPDCTSYHLPKLIIQPFIENAFFHAFIQKTEGYIHVMIAQEGQMLVCEVVDNGDGFEQGEKGNKLPSSMSNRQLFSGIGIRNVHDRITLLYGDSYGVKIMSQPGEGTRVRIWLPVLTDKNNTSI